LVYRRCTYPIGANTRRAITALIGRCLASNVRKIYLLPTAFSYSRHSVLPYVDSHSLPFFLDNQDGDAFIGMIALPPRKMLIPGVILAFFVMFMLLNFQEHSVTGLSSSAVHSFCDSMGIQGALPMPNKLSNASFDTGNYSTGSHDSWIDSDDSVQWSDEETDVQREYGKTTSMMNTNKLLKGNATASFRGMFPGFPD